MEGIAKNSFSHMLGFCNGFGINFDDFWSLGDRLEIEWILRSTLGHPQILRSVVIWLLAGPHSNSQTVGVAIPHARYIMKHEE
jgi:hypothetical protein